MGLINTHIKPFKADAFKDGEFITIDSEDFKDQWSVFFFVHVLILHLFVQLS